MVFSGNWNHFIHLFYAEYLLNTIISWNLAVIMFSKFSSYLCQRKRKINVNFSLESFAFTISGWVLFLEWSCPIIDSESTVIFSQKGPSYMFVRVLKTPLAGISLKSYFMKKNVKIINFTLETSGKRNVIVFRGIFRTQSNIYDRTFLTN